MILKKSSITFLLLGYFVLLSTNGLIWSCASLKQKLSKKGTASLYRQQAFKDQSEALERRERELIHYFGESATLMLKDGFRFHQDSGLMGNTALLHVHSQSVTTDKQIDSSKLANLSEISSREDTQLKTIEIEKQKSSPISSWWLLLLLPIFWIIRKRRF